MVDILKLYIVLLNVGIQTRYLLLINQFTLRLIYLALLVVLLV